MKKAPQPLGQGALVIFTEISQLCGTIIQQTKNTPHGGKINGRSWSNNGNLTV